MTQPEDLKYPDVPELDKLTEVTDKYNVVAQFVEFLYTEQDIYVDPDLIHVFFDLDVKRIEEERRKILAFLREFNAAAEERRLSEGD